MPDSVFSYKAALTKMGGDKDIYTEILGLFLNETPRLLKEISEALNNKNIELIHRNAHSLKSASRTIGGYPLGEIASQLEDQCIIKSPEELQPLVDQLTIEFNLLKVALQKQGFTIPKPAQTDPE